MRLPRRGIATALLAGVLAAGAAARDTRSDTWVATDALGRTLPTYREAGPPRPNRTVGMFYFLWLGEHGTAGPYDISKILARDPNAISEPDNPLWGPMGAPHHWGEPRFGYYLSDDPWVLRKHAQMLSDAGVDAVFFDVTNQLTYPRSYLALCRVWTEVRREGGKTPRIAFLTPFWDPARVVSELYENLYKPGLYADLWFRWEGKPLILADPDALRPERLIAAHAGRRVPAELPMGGSLGQSFTAEKPFLAVGGEFPTWTTVGSGMTLSLYADKPGGRRLARRQFENVADNAAVRLELPEALPAGVYYLEMSLPVGRIGWWGRTDDAYAGGRAFDRGAPTSGDRSLSIRYAGEEQPRALGASPQPMTPEAAAARAREMRPFFTFRKPQPDYFQGPTGPDQWGWLEVTPQHLFRTAGGAPEQMTVGVAQNALDGRLGVLSNPRSHGRSFSRGSQPPPAQQDRTGKNFAEQWGRALEVAPPFVFVTGWNEWIAGRFGSDAPFYGSGPVTFVDEFNREYSRDIEPMRGGHGDDYYYQFVGFVRRYKGVRPNPAPSAPRTIRINSDFRQWTGVGPEYRDDIGDTAHRNHPGWGRAGTYRNTTGRNDFDTMKVARDKTNLYFYVRTKQPIASPSGASWMTLLLNTDSRSDTGWEGYDFAVRRAVIGGREVSALCRCVGGKWQWNPVAPVRMARAGSQMHLAIPRAALGLPSSGKALRLEFKWADNVPDRGDILDFLDHGDVAPNGRFRYRYEAAR